MSMKKPIIVPKGCLLPLKIINQEFPTLKEQSYWILEENLSAMKEQATEDLALTKGTVKAMKGLDKSTVHEIFK